MAFIVLCLSSLVLWPLVISFSEKYPLNVKKVYCALMCFLFVFFIGLRSFNIGTDSPSYAIDFMFSPGLSTSIIKEYFAAKEPLFYSLQSLVRSATASYTIWFSVIAILYMVPCAFFVYRNSDMPYISFIAFISMGYMNFAMAGLRQTIASAFLFFAFDFLKNKKYVRFIVFVLIAAGFHITSLVFLIALFVTKRRIRLWHIISTILVSIFCIVFGKYWLGVAINFVFGESRGYSLDHFGGYSTLVLLILIAFAALLLNDKLTSKKNLKDNNDAFLYKFLLLSIPFQVLAIYQANCFRIAMYFSIFGVLSVIPNTLSVQTDRTIKTLGTSLIIILLLVQAFAFTYWTSNANPYEFYWQMQV